MKRAVLLLIVAVGCGATSSASGPGYGAPLAPPPIDGFCARLAPRETAACGAGDRDACMGAVKTMQNDPASIPPDVKTDDPRVLPCIRTLWERACAFGDASGCLAAADEAVDAKNPGRAAAFFFRACDRSGHGCHELAKFHEPGSRDPRVQPNAAVYESALVKGCDLGNDRACGLLARLLRPRDPRLYVAFMERRCLLVAGDHSECSSLRQTLELEGAPRRDAYDWLPALAEYAELRQATFPAAPTPSPAPSPGGICDVDPRACPPQEGRIAVIPPNEGPPPAVYARRLGELDAACAFGPAPLCVRRAELEWLRWTHALSQDSRNLGVPERFDVRAEMKRLCAIGAAEACVHVAYGFRSFDGGALIRACDLGSARACARYAHDLRANDRTGANRARITGLYTRACRGGISWACSERPSL